MKQALLRDVVNALEAIAPIALAEPWDNVGLLVGDPSQAITRAMLTIDYTTAVAYEVRQAKCDLVIAYHPPIFEATKRMLASGPTELIFDAVRRGVAIYSPHTALDVADGGTNDVLADQLSLRERRPLRPRDALTPRDAPAVGIGRVGRLPGEITLEMVANLLKRGLSVERLLVAGEPDRMIKTVAVCAGAGGELVGDAIAARADLFVTGELRHHDALRALRAGLNVICALHSNSERPTLDRLAARLRQALGEVEFLVSRADRDPFAVS